MKYLLFVVILLLPLAISAQPKLWFSNKIEVGYGKVFIAEQVTLERGVFTKNSVGLGLRFKVSKSVGYKTFYLLQNSKKYKWASEYFLRAALSLQLQ